ncbi:hypothetical protein IE077_002851 [Cardiosporidium cionae]|uniref:RRM domain-containing protein n=1 Tax=Cardiosporidium cionae TaxID=476202 RepID=A0ABQ7J9Q6_9APIC|nr:hypothetical protein IE077_002851 [Cardiosporidium cionae]|eukprot:KAF8820748.1 hypothetical protein IE077_002851 [Cardiosporidium cionae]
MSEAAQRERLKGEKLQQQYDASQQGSKVEDCAKCSDDRYGLARTHGQAFQYKVGISLQNEQELLTGNLQHPRNNHNDDSSLPTEFDLSSRPDNAWGRSVYVKGIPQDATVDQVCNKINCYLSTGFVTKVQLFSRKEHAFVTLSSKMTAAEFISKRIIFRGRLLNLQWRKSGGLMGFDCSESPTPSSYKHPVVLSNSTGAETAVGSLNDEHRIQTSPYKNWNLTCAEHSIPSSSNENADNSVDKMANVLFDAITAQSMPFSEALHLMKKCLSICSIEEKKCHLERKISTISEPRRESEARHLIEQHPRRHTYGGNSSFPLFYGDT